MKLITLSLLLLASLISIQSHAGDSRTYIDARSTSDKDALPFSGAVMVDNTLYLSGALGLNSEGKIPEDPAEEARNVLNAVKGTLESAGMTMDDLASVTVFCSDVSFYSAFNEVYKTYFNGNYPARAFVGSGTLVFNARFEVQAIATKR